MKQELKEIVGYLPSGVREEWRDIVGYEGCYKVSNLGRVHSLKRIVKAKNNSKSSVPSKILKNRLAKNGYVTVVLSKNGMEKNKLVHRLVAESFIPNSSNLREVNHIDFNKTNNYVKNLEWCDRKYNSQHSQDGFRQERKYGEKSHFAKLSDRDVLDIRYAKNKGCSNKFISECYDVSYSTICKVINGVTFKHLPIKVLHRDFIGRKMIYMLKHGTRKSNRH